MWSLRPLPESNVLRRLPLNIKASSPSVTLAIAVSVSDRRVKTFHQTRVANTKRFRFNPRGAYGYIRTLGRRRWTYKLSYEREYSPHAAHTATRSGTPTLPPPPVQLPSPYLPRSLPVSLTWLASALTDPNTSIVALYLLLSLRWPQSILTSRTRVTQLYGCYMGVIESRICVGGP